MMVSKFTLSILSYRISDESKANKHKINKFSFLLHDVGLNACEKKSYIFLRKELPVRLANIMKEIALLPDNLLRTPSVSLVSSMYAKSFEEVLNFEQTEPTEKNLAHFCTALTHIRDRHVGSLQISIFLLCHIKLIRIKSYIMKCDLHKENNHHFSYQQADIVQTMAQGIIELKESQDVEPGMESSIQYFLDRFYMSRISIRMLMNQHSKI